MDMLLFLHSTKGKKSKSGRSVAKNPGGMEQPWSIVAVAVIGRCCQPLFAQVLDPSVTPDDALRVHFMMYSALDACDERLAQQQAKAERHGSVPPPQGRRGPVEAGPD